MYAPTKAMAKVLFEHYDLKYELKEVKLVSKGDEEAKVRLCNNKEIKRTSVSGQSDNACSHLEET